MTVTTNDTPLETAVLLVVFNRPYTTRRVFEAIRQARPKRLYIAADGPRPGVETDIYNCADVRKIADGVDWPCEVKKLYRETNLNCGRGPSSAFTWFFSHEEEGIILEDDCLPAPSFFRYCEELLQRYRHDTRVMHIGGNNFNKGWQNDKDYSYYFSRSGHIWGWATWRRAWDKFDFNIELYDKLKRKNFFTRYFLNPLERVYRLRKFDITTAKRGKADWWDYQWDFARFVNSGLAIVPSVNLVKNIGFDENATHTASSNSSGANLLAQDIAFPLRHPPFMIRDKKSDEKYFSTFMLENMISKFKFSLTN
jgi:hypothetical protein